MTPFTEKMNPCRKAAILIASVERDKAATLLRSLSSKAIRKIAAEIRELGEIPLETRNRVFREFSSKLREGVNPRGGEELARNLLQNAMGDAKAKELLGKTPGGSRRAFLEITAVNGEDLANILSNEQPSVVAMILAFMPPEKSAEVMNYLDPEMREEVIAKLSCPRNADPDVVAKIEKIFVDKVVSVLHTTQDIKGDSLGGSAFVSEMFQHVDHSLEEEMMGAIQAVSPERANEIRDLMFTFEDVVKLADQDMQKVLRQVSLDKLVVALKGVESPVYKKIAGNLSKRAQETLQEEMDLLGKVRLSEVEEEQRNFVASIRALEAAGEIKIKTSDEEEIYV